MCLRPEDKKTAGITLLILNSWNEISGPGKLQNDTMSLPKSSAMAISKSETRDLEYLQCGFCNKWVFQTQSKHWRSALHEDLYPFLRCPKLLAQDALHPAGTGYRICQQEIVL